MSLKKNLILPLLLLISSEITLSKINFKSSGSSLILDTGSKMTVHNTITDFSGTLHVPTLASTSLEGIANVISFVDGVLKTSTTHSNLSATLDSTTNDTISLENNDFLDVQSGSIVQTVSVASGATATILGQPQFSGAVALGNASSVIKFNIATALNQSVTGSGKLFLINDLTLESGVQLPSLVEQQGKKLHITGGTISSGFTNTTGGIIELHSNTSITAALTLGTGSDSYTISGNGNTLTLSGSGSINLAATTGNLNFSDVHIKGMSSTNFIKGTGEVRFVNSTIELGGNYSRTDGDFLFTGDNCKVITNGSTFTISGAGNTLTIDGVVLFYEQLDGSGQNPFAEESDGTIIKTNGGDIKPLGGAATSVIFDVTPTTLDKNYDLMALATVTFNNDTPATPRPMSLVGGGHFMQFPCKAGSFLIIDANTQVTTSDAVLKDFFPAAIAYGDPLAKIVFGDDTVIEMGKDLTIESGDRAWEFNGNATVDGKGKTLTINKASGVTITGAKTLTLKNMKILTTVIDGLQCLTDTAKISFENVEFLVEQAGFDFDTGDMCVDGKVSISGGAINAIDPTTTFELSTKGNLTIGENARLTIDPDIIFKYNIDPADDAGSLTPTYDSKRHITFLYPSSTLCLNGCTLLSTTTGIGFDFGTIEVNNKVTFDINAAIGAEAEIGSQVRMNISGSLDVTGPLRYITSTWP
jgi:hypothetical protein